MEFSIEHSAKPVATFRRYETELSLAGAQAFGREPQEFAPQVRDRFEAAKFAQIIKLGQNVMGFALYDIMRSSVWQCAMSRG